MRTKPSSKPYVVLSTAASQKEAKRIAKALIEARLAACVNVVPRLESFFYWQGQLERASEALLVIKTDLKRLSGLKAKILKLHSYQVPEIIGWPIKWGSKPYLDWVSKSVA
jgi:periplasmic divalent cation tolerance protein